MKVVCGAGFRLPASVVKKHFRAKGIKHKGVIFMEIDAQVRYARYMDRLDKLTKKGGNARIVAKLKRRIKAFESKFAA